MPSSYSTRNRLIKQATGEGANVWGDLQSSGDFDMIDFALDGWTIKALTADVTLTTANATTDEARARCLKFTGTGSYTVTIPSLEKNYLVWNATSGTLTVTTGAGATAVLLTGEIVPIICDASAVKRMTLLTMSAARLQDVADPTSNQDAATKKYVDDTAFSMAAGALPGQPGNADTYLSTDGATAGWRTFSASASIVRTGTSTTVALTPGDTYNALAEVTLTYGATVTPDMSTFLNAVLTLTGNVTLANPSNPKVGQRGRIRIVQDATGSRLLSAVGTSWKRDGGLATLSTAASAQDFLVFEVISSTYILYDIIKSPT